MNERYNIHIKETVDPSWAAWFDGLSITTLPDNGSILSGSIIDQAALHGVLNKIRDLGLTLLAVYRVEEGDGDG
jgi:hypothetical protein